MPFRLNRGARRLLAATIGAFALHGAVASIVPALRTNLGPETVAPVTLARIERHPNPTPSPIATATAPPVIGARPARSTPPTDVHVRHAPALRAGSLRPIVRSTAHARPEVDLPSGGSGAGSGSQTGTGGGGASGSGSGDRGGNGTGGAQPCGFVTFSDPEGSRYDAATGGFYVTIAMTVHYSNGGTGSIALDYQWYYPSEAANPWSRRNRDDPNFPTTFQQPPPDKRDAEPSIVRYVMDHTSADGYTLLKECPSASPPPS
ncbi:MAG TPA: hypothetical protein VGF98_08985 [Candidatus Tumulicola sp.]